MASDNPPLISARPGLAKPASQDPASKSTFSVHRQPSRAGRPGHPARPEPTPRRCTPSTGGSLEVTSVPHVRTRNSARLEEGAKDESQATFARLTQLSAISAVKPDGCPPTKVRQSSIEVPMGLHARSVSPFDTTPVHNIKDLIKQTAQSNEQTRLKQPMSFMQLSNVGKMPAASEISTTTPNTRSACGETTGSSEFEAQVDAHSACGISLEDRVARLEKSAEALHTKNTEQVMSASVALSRAVEERLVRQLTEMRKELWQALQSAIGQEVSTIRFEMAGQAIPGLTSSSKMEALSNNGQVSDLRTRIQVEVGEAVRVETSRIQAAQDELKQTVEKAVDELREFLDGNDMKGSSQVISGSTDTVENLQKMVKETLKISDYLAMELGRERSSRIDTLEDAISQVEASIQGSSIVRHVSIPKGSRSASVGSRPASLGPSSAQVHNDLTKSKSLQNRFGAPNPISPADGRQARNGAFAWPSPATSSEDWGRDVAALRSRVEAVFHVDEPLSR